jgi:hypothetical protein
VSGAIVPREVIARQAAAAAALAAKQPHDPPPPNPYCEHMEPEHHLAWHASFKRHLHVQLAPDSESSA